MSSSPARTSRRITGAALVVLAAACGSPSPEPPPAPIAVAWHEVALPAADAPGRTIRDLAQCDGRWYAVGALRTPGAAGGPPANRPAAWISDDGRTWQAVRMQPVSFSGESHVLYSVACHGRRVVALGAASGGVHGNPRTGTWLPVPGGAWREAVPEFETFAGMRSINVARLVAGPAGFLIAGNWLGPADLPGAAAWRSIDGRTWRRQDADPALASTPELQTRAHDAGAAGGGWVLVGEAISGPPPRAAATAWTSTDGVTWRRLDLPSEPEPAVARRVVVHGDGVLALGRRGPAFAAWRGGPAGAWTAAGSFGNVTAGPAVYQVDGLVGVRGDLVLAAVADGARCALWASADAGGSWHEVVPPRELKAGAEVGLRVAATADRLLVATDDGRDARLWTGAVADLAR